MAAPREGERHRGAFAAAAAAVAAIDQLSKQWALTALDDGSIDLVGTLRLKLVFNDGAAFSVGAGRTTVISVVGILVAAYVVHLGWRAGSRAWALGLGIILGGALGNLLDRALRDGDGLLGGRVVDFIDLQWWPVFNVADTALWIGVGVLVVTSRRDGRSS